MRETCREERYQLVVPEELRAAVPARYGVEMVKDKSATDSTLIISDQLHNRHVDTAWHDEYLLYSLGDLKERIVDPLLSFLQRENARRA